MSRILPIVPLIPRGINHCLDLAVRYVGRFLSVVLGMWLLIALPASTAVYALALLEKIDLRLVAVVIYFATLPLGILIMNDAVPRLFGRSLQHEPDPAASSGGWFAVSVVLVILGLAWAFLAENLGDLMGLSVRMRLWSIWAGLGLAGFVVGLGSLLSVARHQQIDWGTARTFFLGLCLRSLCALGPAFLIFPPFADWRLGLLLLVTVIPGIWLALRTGFLIERACLSRLDPDLHNDQVPELIKDETGDLFGRACWMMHYSLLIWVVLFMTADAVSSLIFRTPIFMGRLANIPAGAGWEDSIHLAGELVFRDPLVLATLTATALLVYPINRLAWFFCYIDIRVRKDCWNLELQFWRQSRKLAESLARENSALKR